MRGFFIKRFPFSIPTLLLNVRQKCFSSNAFRLPFQKTLLVSFFLLVAVAAHREPVVQSREVLELVARAAPAYAVTQATVIVMTYARLVRVAVTHAIIIVVT